MPFTPKPPVEKLPLIARKDSAYILLVTTKSGVDLILVLPVAPISPRQL